LKGKQGADDARYKDCSTFQVHERGLILPAEGLHFLVPGRTLEEEENEDKGDSAEREVDVEASVVLADLDR